MKYIIDTDPGIDDAIAIMLGMKNDLDVIGFTLASGNIPVKKSEKNLGIIQDFLETNIKMYRGTFENNCDHDTAEFAHGKDGLGYAVFPDIYKRKFERQSAEDIIYKMAKKYKNELTLICFGPLTNLANSIKKHPDLNKYLKHILIMGVSYADEASEPYLEFNINVDVDAAKLVFDTYFDDVKVVTHEVGVQSFIEKDYIDNLRNSEDLVSRFVGEIGQKYMEFSKEHYNTIGLGTPDPTTVATLIDENIVSFVPCKIDVIDKGDKKGQTIVDVVDKSNIQISNDFNLERFRKVFKNTFK